MSTDRFLNNVKRPWLPEPLPDELIASHRAKARLVRPELYAHETEIPEDTTAHPGTFTDLGILS